MNPAGTRKAALALASMHPMDRRWMLAQLPGRWKSALGPLVADARRFAALDHTVLQMALANEDSHATIDAPTPNVLIAVLDQLSVAWAARVLAAAAMDHVDIYLATCNMRRAEAIRAELDRLPTPLPAAFAHAVALRLSECGQRIDFDGVDRGRLDQTAERT